MPWLLLVLTLPTENTTARMRAWRTLEASGASVLRDGVYLLPARETCRVTLAEVAEDIRANGGLQSLGDRIQRCSQSTGEILWNTPAWDLVGGAQDPVKGRFRGQVAPLIDQCRDDLVRAQSTYKGLAAYGEGSSKVRMARTTTFSSRLERNDPWGCTTVPRPTALHSA